MAQTTAKALRTCTLRTVQHALFPLRPRLSGLTGLVAALLLASVAPATAGTYRVTACDSAPDGLDHTWFGAGQGDVAAYAACPSVGQPDRGIVLRPGYTGRNDFGSGTLTFFSPDGTAISGLDINGCFLAESPGWTVALQTPSAVVASGRSGGCGSFHWNLPGVPTLQWLLRCDSGIGCYDDTTTGVRLRQATVTIEDDNKPAVTNGGGMWGVPKWQQIPTGPVPLTGET